MKGRIGVTVAVLALAAPGVASASHTDSHDRRARPLPPASPPGLYQTGQVETTCPTTVDQRPEEARLPSTGPINRYEQTNRYGDAQQCYSP
jgi:hypothetical protein